MLGYDVESLTLTSPADFLRHYIVTLYDYRLNLVTTLYGLCRPIVMHTYILLICDSGHADLLTRN
jgi:hypothetical protein